MPGVPLDVMDKFKALFRRKTPKQAPVGTGASKTENPNPTETGPAIPAPAQIAQDVNNAPSSSDPTAPQPGAAPGMALQIPTPAPGKPGSTLATATSTSEAAEPATGASKPQVKAAAAAPA